MYESKNIPNDWIPNLDKVNEICIFKYEERKNPKSLIEAFYLEFKKQENIILNLQTYIFMHPNGRDINIVLDELENVKNEILKKYKYLNKENLPEINIISNVIPTEMMPHLFKVMDAFVLPSNEGFGLPFAEAMAMELPTIALNYSGQLEFMNNNNSYLVSIDKSNNKRREFMIPNIESFKRTNA
ncbi:hypothetical protein ABK040_015069 [Willaertia magna]